jgi:hypothetical protein
METLYTSASGGLRGAIRDQDILKHIICCEREGVGDDEEMRRFVPVEDVFKGRDFDRQIVVLCVSRYASFKLSLRDLVIMMADRGSR